MGNFAVNNEQQQYSRGDLLATLVPLIDGLIPVQERLSDLVTSSQDVTHDNIFGMSSVIPLGKITLEVVSVHVGSVVGSSKLSGSLVLNQAGTTVFAKQMSTGLMVSELNEVGFYVVDDNYLRNFLIFPDLNVGIRLNVSFTYKYKS